MQATHCCPVLLSKFTYKHQTLVVTYTPNLYVQKSLYSDDIQYTIAPTTVKRNCYSLPHHPLVMYFNSCGNTPVIVQMNTKGIKKLPFSNSSKRYSGTDTCWEHITEMGLWFNFPGEICSQFLLEHSAFPSDWNKTPKYRPLVDKILPASRSQNQIRAPCACTVCVTPWRALTPELCPAYLNVFPGPDTAAHEALFLSWSKSDRTGKNTVGQQVLQDERWKSAI